MSQSLQIESVNKVIISDIEKSLDELISQRAIEIFTDEGKLMIILTGPDVKLYDEEGKEFKREGSV